MAPPWRPLILVHIPFIAGRGDKEADLPAQRGPKTRGTDGGSRPGPPAALVPPLHMLPAFATSHAARPCRVAHPQSMSIKLGLLLLNFVVSIMFDLLSILGPVFQLGNQYSWQARLATGTLVAGRARLGSRGRAPARSRPSLSVVPRQAAQSSLPSLWFSCVELRPCSRRPAAPPCFFFSRRALPIDYS